MAPRIVFFDLETRKLASDLRPDDEQAGWDALRRGDGGISALGIYDTKERWLFLYDDADILAISAHLEAADVVVGFRSEAFDVPVVEGLAGRSLRLREHIDMYALIARSNAQRGIVGQKGDYTLDAIARRSFGSSKSGSGATAPVLASKGLWGRLFNYCALDVRLTRDLFVHICEHGGVVNHNHTFLPLVIPDWVKRGVVKD